MRIFVVICAPDRYPTGTDGQVTRSKYESGFKTFVDGAASSDLVGYGTCIPSPEQARGPKIEAAIVPVGLDNKCCPRVGVPLFDKLGRDNVLERGWLCCDHVVRCI